MEFRAVGGARAPPNSPLDPPSRTEIIFFLNKAKILGRRYH